MEWKALMRTSFWGCEFRVGLGILGESQPLVVAFLERVETEWTSLLCLSMFWDICFRILATLPLFVRIQYTYVISLHDRDDQILSRINHIRIISSDTMSTLSHQGTPFPDLLAQRTI